MLRAAFDEADASKFLWGTDNPVLEAVIPMKDWLNMIKELPGNAPDGIKFTKEEIDAVLGETPRKSLVLKAKKGGEMAIKTYDEFFNRIKKMRKIST
jgi:predicted HicB family RNase H-like nuclease